MILHHSIQSQCLLSNEITPTPVHLASQWASKSYQKASVAKERHVYVAIWTPEVSKEPLVDHEYGNEYNQLAIAEMTDGETVSHLRSICTIWRISLLFVAIAVGAVIVIIAMWILCCVRPRCLLESLHLFSQMVCLLPAFITNWCVLGFGI